MIDEVVVFDMLVAVVNSVLLGQVAGMFFAQYRKTREPLMLLLTVCFGSFCGSSVVYFLRFFISTTLLPLWRLETSARFAAFATFVLLFERQVKQRRVPVLTLICMACIAGIMLIPAEEIAYPFSATIYVAALVVLWFFFQVIRDTEGQVRQRVSRALLGAFLLGLGIGFSADYIVAVGGQVFVGLGLITQVIGLIVIGASFATIRSADEFKWADNVQTLYVIFNSLCIYAYSFEQRDLIPDGDLKGSGLASVLMVAQSIVRKQQPPEHIENQNLHFLVKRGEKEFAGDRCVVVLLVRKNLQILHEKLHRYVARFESTFGGVLSNWNGNVDFFHQQGGDLVQIFLPRVAKKAGKGS